MPGGVLQLAAYGAQDFYLTGNPQISFFKTVYRRYTNFAMEYYSLAPENNIGLSETDTTTYIFSIKRHGDLVSDMYFEFVLPNISSLDTEKFRWIENIGFNIIHSTRIYIGGNLIDQNYGEWFDIWNELTNTETDSPGFNDMIGNIPELFDPEEAPAQIGYPTNTVQSFIPTILEKKVRVPLIYWFNRNPALSIPLVSLQYHPVEVHIELRKISDLYTVIDDFDKIIKPSPDLPEYKSRYSIQNFTDDAEVTFIENGVEKTLINFTIQPRLLVNYIYLDKTEMAKFAKSEHKFLITQVKKNEFKNVIGSKTLELELQHPTSFMVIICKRTDVDLRNDWNNYTTWINSNEPPYAKNFTNRYFEKFGNDELLQERVINISRIFPPTPQNQLQEKYEMKKKPYILKSLLLKLNGTDRFAEQDPEYFNFLQPNSFSKRIPKKGIFFYSFSINPFDYQPSGSCNFSRFNNIELFIETVDSPTVTSLSEKLYKFDINVYTVNYNILRIISGMGNLEFAN